MKTILIVQKAYYLVHKGLGKSFATFFCYQL
jgi:hypothetical protein